MELEEIFTIWEYCESHLSESEGETKVSSTRGPKLRGKYGKETWKSLRLLSSRGQRHTSCPHAGNRDSHQQPAVGAANPGTRAASNRDPSLVSSRESPERSGGSFQNHLSSPSKCGGKKKRGARKRRRKREAKVQNPQTYGCLLLDYTSAGWKITSPVCVCVSCICSCVCPRAHAEDYSIALNFCVCV